MHDPAHDLYAGQSAAHDFLNTFLQPRWPGRGPPVSVHESVHDSAHDFYAGQSAEHDCLDTVLEARWLGPGSAQSGHESVHDSAHDFYVGQSAVHDFLDMVLHAELSGPGQEHGSLWCAMQAGRVIRLPGGPPLSTTRLQDEALSSNCFCSAWLRRMRKQSSARPPILCEAPATPQGVSGP